MKRKDLIKWSLTLVWVSIAIVLIIFFIGSMREIELPTAIAVTQLPLPVSKPEPVTPVMQMSDDPQIRVLIKNGSQITHSNLYITCRQAFYCNDHKKPANKVINIKKMMKKHKELTLSSSHPLYLCRKDGEILGEGYEGSFHIRKEEDTFVLINELPLEQYLCYVLPSEMPTYFSYEALKAQAVCARTFAYKHLNSSEYQTYDADLDDSTSYQVYHKSERYDITDQAVADTKGLVLTYRDELADCYYYSTNSGYGENLEVWESDSPAYLRAGNHTEDGKLNLSRKKIFHQFILDTPASADDHSPYYRWDAYLSPELGMDESYGRLLSLKVNERSDSGYVLSLTAEFELGERTYTKEIDIRFALGKYLSKLRLNDGSERTDLSALPSACFEIEGREDGHIHLRGGGFGHGIGMSQYGASKMGESCSFEEILTYYFKGCTLQTL